MGRQLIELTSDLGRTLVRLRDELGPVGSVTPETYGKIDHTIGTILRIPAIAAVCGMTVPVDGLFDGYVDYKSGLGLNGELREE